VVVVREPRAEFFDDAIAYLGYFGGTEEFVDEIGD
jgi:hypothetical protein